MRRERDEAGEGNNFATAAPEGLTNHVLVIGLSAMNKFPYSFPITSPPD